MFRNLVTSLADLRSGGSTRDAAADRSPDTRALTDIVEQLAEQQRAHMAESARWMQEAREQSAALASLHEKLDRLALRESQLRVILESDVTQQSRFNDLDQILKEERIAKIAATAVERAELHVDPCPHVVIEDLFPRRFYSALVRGIPPAPLFEDEPDNRQQLAVPFTLAPAYSRRVWSFMSDVVERVMVPLLLDKFRAPLEAWIAENWPALAADPFGPPMVLHGNAGRLMRRRRNYNIPTHRDPKWGFLTCLLYLVRPGDQETWGTRLYAVESDREATGSQPHWIDPQTCRLVREIPFRANSALVFLNSTGAHGASIPADAEPADLERYIYQFRVGPTRESIAALMALLPEERQPAWAGKLVEA